MKAFDNESTRIHSQSIRKNILTPRSSDPLVLITKLKVNIYVNRSYIYFSEVITTSNFRELKNSKSSHVVASRGLKLKSAMIVSYDESQAKYKMHQTMIAVITLSLPFSLFVRLVNV
jgi:hypothetical protein